MYKQQKAFSFVELIIVLAIILLLSVIVMTNIGNKKQDSNNMKLKSDLITISNALEQYKSETGLLPTPNGNNNYFKGDSSYAHSGSSDSFGVYGSFTEKTLAKKYIDTTPLDPVSKNYYSYGKTLNNKYYEVGGVLRIDDKSETILHGNYPGEYGPISLIREYNGGYFISDKSTTHLPYNPDEHILTATDQNGKIYRKGDTITTTGSTLNLYFSDGSVSTLEENSTLKLSDIDFKTPDNNLLTKVKLFLSAGSIFTKATALNQDSDFEIYTSDTAAAVRGTIFSVSTNTGSTEVKVFSGAVEVYQADNAPEGGLNIEPGNIGTEVIEGKQIYIYQGTTQEEYQQQDIYESEYEIERLDKTIDIVEDNIPKGITLESIENGEPEKITDITTNKENIDKIKYGELYAYAEYNTAGNINLLDKDGNNSTFTTKSSSIIGNTYNFSSKCDSLYNKSKSFCEKDGKEGIFINNNLNNDFLKYTGLHLGNDFTIKMSVYPTANGGYIFYTSDDNHNNNKFNYYSYSWQSNNNNVDGINDKSFNTIVFQCNNGTPSITINDSEQTINDNPNCYGFNDIYIGSKSDTEGQFNGIINYVRIYKKID